MLYELQKAFLNQFRQKEQDDYLEHIRSSDNMSQQEKFAIYADSVTEGLANALRETYPVTEKLVGEEFFRAMSYQFVNKTASHSPSLNHYGGEFADFVANFPAANDVPYLADISRLEWAWQTAYYGPDLLPLDVDGLTDIDSDQQDLLIFTPPLNSTLLKSPHPIHDIWQLHQHEDMSDEDFKLDWQGVCLIVWRPAMEVLIEVMTETQYQILLAFDQAMTLGQLSKHFQSKFDLSSEIPGLVSRGWIADYQVENSTK